MRQIAIKSLDLPGVHNPFVPLLRRRFEIQLSDDPDYVVFTHSTRRLRFHDGTWIYFNARRAFREESLLSLFQPFEVLEKRYIFGKEFNSQRKQGFGVGCYHLQAPA